MLVGVEDPPERTVYVPLQRCLSAFHQIDLAWTVESGGPYTLIAPVDGAFDSLPWSFERLIADDALLQPRFDLFEYFAVLGDADPQGPVEAYGTFQGEAIRVGDGRVFGGQGTARILASFVWRGLPVHAVDACVLPSTLSRKMWPN